MFCAKVSLQIPEISLFRHTNAAETDGESSFAGDAEQDNYPEPGSDAAASAGSVSEV